MNSTEEQQLSEPEISSETLTKLIDQNRAVIADYQQTSGAYPAAPHFEVYNYSWFRDGSFIADAMSRAGDIESAEQFFGWCAKVINDRRDHILSGGKMHARYTYEGDESNKEWEEFQLDGYGTLIWAMKQHATRHNRDLEQFSEATGLIQHYLATNWQEHCFDWWEERKGQHAASLACIYAGLQAFEHPESSAVRSAIDLSNERTDASLLACFLLGAVSAEDFAPTLKKIESELIAPDGGMYRYRADTYYGGGEWPVLTAMLGLYYAQTGQRQKAAEKLGWIVEQIDEHGWLPEQTQSHLLKPDEYEPWVQRWGQPAKPLLWSHAMLITLANELNN